MQLIAEKLGKNDKLDRLRYLRDEGSETACPMPRQGILPHDLVHYVVESRLVAIQGFTSLVAAGAAAQFAMEQTHDPAGSQVHTEAIQIEAIVEALQTQLWSGRFDEADFAEGIRSACEARATPPCPVDCGPALFGEAQALHARWTAVPFHASLSLDFPAGPIR